MIFLYIFAGLYLFWMWAVAALNLYRGYLSGAMTRETPAYWLALPAIFGFVLADWVMNRTVFLLLCWEGPLTKTELVTQRLARYRTNGGNPWRLGIANFICGTLNFFNYNQENHC